MNNLTKEDIRVAIRDARRNLRELIRDLPSVPTDLREGMLEAENLAVTITEDKMKIHWWNDTGNLVQKHTAIISVSPPAGDGSED